MPTLKQIAIVALIAMIGMPSFPDLGHTAGRHLVNTVAGSLREGPGTQAKIVKTLAGDQSFEVLETANNFIRIRTEDGSEGWVENRDNEPSPRLEAPTLSAKDDEKGAPGRGHYASKGQGVVNELPTRKEGGEQVPSREAVEVKKLQAEISAMSQKIEQLEAEATAAEQLKGQNDALQTESSAMKATIAELQQANLALDRNNDIYWFLAGGAVFLFGWLLGRTTLRRQRHSSLTL